MRGKYVLIVVVLLTLAFGVGRLAAAPGTLDSPAPPDSTSSYTLEDIYNRLNGGAAGAQSTFTEPSSGPGTETMHTLNQIMDRAPAADNTDGAVPAEVLTGKTYWSLRTDGSGGSSWGLETGTAAAGDNVSGPEGARTFTIPDGFYAGSKTATANDSDLAAGNIASGVGIFEVTGAAIVATGDATASDVLTDKTFSNASQAGIAGTMPDNGAVVITPTTTNTAIVAGYHNGSGYVVGDADLVAGNIISGVEIFGVSGEWHGGCVCTGVLNGTRWCDNGDGTVTDLTTCLVWLKKADWGGLKPWEDCENHDDVHSRVAGLQDGAAGADLSDGSDFGDWRLPTLREFDELTHGSEAVLASTPRAFTGVQSSRYWSSLAIAQFAEAWCLDDAHYYIDLRSNSHWVWPVRGEQ
jgi:hypothetical protein